MGQNCDDPDQTALVVFHQNLSYNQGPSYKTFSMPNTAEHEILSAHKNKKYQDIQRFSGVDKPTMLFFLHINVKMPTTVGIFTFMCRKNFMLS